MTRVSNPGGNGGDVYIVVLSDFISTDFRDEILETNKRLTEAKGLCFLGSTILLIVVTLSTFVECKEIPWYRTKKLEKYRQAGLTGMIQECIHSGRDMLVKNGSAVDAAIAILLCEGVASLHSMGLGGGFMMTIWDTRAKSAYFLDARETASRHANSTMYNGREDLIFSGGLSVAVPGELAGYWEAHQQFGKLDWEELFQPAIALAEKGFKVSYFLNASMAAKEAEIRAEPSLAEILIDQKTNRLFKVGDIIKRPKLAKTLKILSSSDGSGVHEFYNGSIAKNLVREIKEFNGIIDEQDFSSYKISWRKPVRIKLGNMTMYTSPPPGSGALLAFIMNVLEEVDFKSEDEPIFYQYIVETFKWAYARRTELGDPDFESHVNDLVNNIITKEYAKSIRKKIRGNWTSNDPQFYGVKTVTLDNYGTYHTSIIAPDGSAVAVTSTINQLFGALIRSKSTGIIFNDQMDDFSVPSKPNSFDLPSSPTNFIAPGKRPMSSMVPTIVLDENNELRLVIGGVGGSKIVTSVALAMILNLWAGYDIKEAVEANRIHHQLFPMKVQVESGFPDSIKNYLSSIGHIVTGYDGMDSVVNAVAKQNGIIMPYADYRRQGKSSGF